MKTTWLGEQKVICHGGRYFAWCDESADAVTQAEWAAGVLAAPVVVWPNGRNSHEVASNIIEKAEDDLIAHLLITVKTC